jgi:hypothetical protein
MVQTAVSDPTLRKGQIVEGWPQGVISRAAGGDLAAGSLVKWGTSPEQQVIELPALPAADPDAIMTAAALASSAAAQSIDASSFDGATGSDRIAPAATITVTFDGSADWDTPSGECRVDIYGVDASGASVRDTVAKPNGSGAGAYETEVAFASVTHVDVEACNGAGGTATMGTGTSRYELSQKDYPGVALYESIKEPNTDAREFAQYEDVAVLKSGIVAVQVEHAVSSGDDAYVRVVAAGTDLRGQWTGQDGAETPATYARFPAARFVSSADADGIAHLEIGG